MLNPMMMGQKPKRAPGDGLIAMTPKDTVLRDGTASLYHFRATHPKPTTSVPLLLVPSMINRWYVLDLRAGASVAEAMVAAGIDTYLLDWGIPRDEDRYLSWDLILDRLGRMIRRVRRETGAQKVAVLGYCMGGTLSSIYTALNPEHVAGFVNLTGPIDFNQGGMLRTFVDARWFDPIALTEPGNLPAPQMESGFTSLRPTSKISKYVTIAERWHDEKFMNAFEALDTWASDNIAFPASAYRTYIGELYQQNLLARGEHYVKGKRADLGNITCPVLNIIATRDTICPGAAATALERLVSSDDITQLAVPGGHVGAVVGSKASRELYPAIARWMLSRFPIAPPALAAADAPDDEDDHALIVETAPEVDAADESDETDDSAQAGDDDTSGGGNGASGPGAPRRRKRR